MANLKIRYMVSRPKDDGTQRHYWQPDKILREAGWKMRRLSDNQSEAIVEAEDINQAVDQYRCGMINSPVNERPGSLDAVIASYKKSRDFKSLSDKTAEDYKRYLKHISEWAGDVQAAMINAKMVQDLYETLREKKPRKAAYLIQVLRLLFSFAERQSMIPKNTNPATKPMLSYKARKGTIWTHDDVLDFVRTADEMGYPDIGTAVMLNEWLGQRRGDIISMRRSAYKNGSLHIRQSKTGAEVTLPVDMVPELKERIEQQIARNEKLNPKRRHPCALLIQTQDGNAYTADGFMSAFERIRTKAGDKNKRLKTLIFKDLRHTAVTRLAESGAEIPQIASVTGHTFKSCQDIVDRYNIRTSKMAREAFSKRITAEGIEAKRQSEIMEENHD